MNELIRLHAVVTLCCAWLCSGVPSGAAQAGQAIPGISQTKEEPPAPAPPDAVPLAAVAPEVDATLASLRSELGAESVRADLEALEKSWPALNRDVALRARENGRILAQLPSLDLLRQLDGRWRDVQATLGGFSARLEHVVAAVEQRLERLGVQDKRWAATAQAAKEQGAPPELLARIGAVRKELDSARQALDAGRSRALKLQTSTADLGSRVDAALEANRSARDALLGTLFTRDSAALWQVRRPADAPQSMLAGAEQALEAQGVALRSYVRDRMPLVAAHGVLLALLTVTFYWARGGLRALVAKEATLARAAAVVAHPLATALVLALMLTHWIYPEPPRALLAINGIAIFVPTILVLRRLVPRPLIAPLYAVLVFYFLDQARSVSASVDLLPRLLFVGEMSAAALFLLWFAHSCRLEAADESRKRFHARAWRAAARVASALCAASAIAAAAGFVLLSNLVGDTVLGSLYAALVLYTAVRILDALVEIALRAGPLTASRMVRNHRLMLQRRVGRALQWLAIFVWILHVLDRLAIRDRVIGAARSALDASLSLGRIEVSLLDVLTFVAVVWAAFLVSRLVRFVLDEEVFPHTRLKRGVPYAITRTLHIVIVTLGLVLALSALGMEMTKLTILVSAFTIGVGFGLQNIFNNLVSGLIVLFERPVQVGDMIQIDDAVGMVERIGIRASVVRAANGSEIIVPNGKLISDRLVNWTLPGHRRVIDVPISVTLQSDPETVIETLERIAKEHPAVVQDPPVQAIVTRMGPDWMGLELRAAIRDVERWMIVRSELAVSAAKALRAANVTLR